MFKENIWKIIELAKKDCDLDGRKESILTRYLEDIEALLVLESTFKWQVTLATLRNIFQWVVPALNNEPIDNKVKEFYGYVVLNKRVEEIKEATKEEPITDEWIVTVDEDTKSEDDKGNKEEVPTVTEDTEVKETKITEEYLSSLSWDELKSLWEKEWFTWQSSKANIKEYLLTRDNEKENEDLPKENA